MIPRRLATTLLRQSTSSRAPRIITSAVRSASTTGTAAPKRYYAPNEKKGIRIGTPFLGLTFIGLSATSYGLYQFYSTFTTYPSAIRTHLRAALRSSLSADYPRADRSFTQAYDLALQLANQGNELGMTPEERRRKITGIAISWAGVWESAGDTEKALEIYGRAWSMFVEAIEASRQRLADNGGVNNAGVEQVGDKEIMRAVSIALKMGDLVTVAAETTASGARMKGFSLEGELRAERYYVFAVEEMLRLSLNPVQTEQTALEVLHQIAPSEDTKASEEANGKKRGLVIAEAVSPIELASGLERLGEYYTRRGNMEYAQPLLVQAIAVLLPPPSKDGKPLPIPSIRTRCHAATLMNNLSSALVSTAAPDKNAINQAAGWSRQSLVVSAQAKQEGILSRKASAEVVPLKDREEAECELCSVVATFNLGALSELSKDPATAKSWFEKSKTNAQRLGLKEGLVRSEQALKRLASVK